VEALSAQLDAKERIKQKAVDTKDLIAEKNPREPKIVSLRRRSERESGSSVKRVVPVAATAVARLSSSASSIGPVAADAATTDDRLQEAPNVDHKPTHVSKDSLPPRGPGLSSVVGGVLAGTSSNRSGSGRQPGDEPDPPQALETEYPFKEILLAAAIQGAIFSVGKTVIDRQGARLFEKWDP